jgi:uncharacterized membrane protein YcaP (DUF421 family)
MQVPDRGMLPAILILGVAVAFQRGLAVWGFKNRKVEVITHGDVNVLVQDGRIFLDEMRMAAMSRERLFALLRARSIEHLGQVRRVYLETSGDISVYELARPKPGLSVLPAFDDHLRASDNIVPNMFACSMCGALRRSNQKPTAECEFCENTEWAEAVEEVAVGARKAEKRDGDGSDGDGRDGWTSQPDGRHGDLAPRH